MTPNSDRQEVEQNGAIIQESAPGPPGYRQPGSDEDLSDALFTFYWREIAPILPLKILDFHTHTWSMENWKEKPWEADKTGGQYMVTDGFYPPERLLQDAYTCFPSRDYQAVCFGYPTPASDWKLDTAYVAEAARSHAELWPLVLAGSDLGLSRQQYESALAEGHFYGFKVFLNWYGDDYGDRRVEDMLGPTEIALANERRLVIVLHVPGRGRLADPRIQAGVKWLSRACPAGQIVLAHCGRCYLPSEMQMGITSLRGLPNVWMDTSMVMDPVVFQIALNEIGPGRLLFGTDFPVAAMRGRRVRVMDHWVDVVLPGYPPSAYRVTGDGIRAGFMAWEIVLAIRWACEMAGISPAERDGIFYTNGMALLQAVHQ
jgi:predicted TIM-barrel fold metal-dependent hydrolase